MEMTLNLDQKIADVVYTINVNGHESFESKHIQRWGVETNVDSQRGIFGSIGRKLEAMKAFPLLNNPKIKSNFCT